MVNDFPARDRVFITKLAEDLHLTTTWDEYDDEDRNLVTWRFPGELDEPSPESGHPSDEENSDDWEDEEDEDEEFDPTQNGAAAPAPVLPPPSGISAPALSKKRSRQDAEAEDPTGEEGDVDEANETVLKKARAGDEPEAEGEAEEV